MSKDIMIPDYFIFKAIRRNSKSLEQMYKLVSYSKAPMQPAIWIARIDGKLEQRVVMEKEEYDKLIKKEKAFDTIYKALTDYYSNELDETDLIGAIDNIVNEAFAE